VATAQPGGTRYLASYGRAYLLGRAHGDVDGAGSPTRRLARRRQIRVALPRIADAGMALPIPGVDGDPVRTRPVEAIGCRDALIPSQLVAGAGRVDRGGQQLPATLIEIGGAVRPYGGDGERCRARSGAQIAVEIDDVGREGCGLPG